MQLPTIVSELKRKWDLSEVIPVANMSYHYVAKAIQFSERPVVLKIGCDEQLIKKEASVLKANNSGKMVSLLDERPEFNALLLSQAQPGTALMEIYPQELDDVMQEYANLILNLHKYVEIDKSHYPHISEWLEPLNRTRPKCISKELFSIAKAKKDQLLFSMSKPRLLHGDLHLDNILNQGANWVYIDPKGVWGELEFEIAAFDIFAPSEVKQATASVFLMRIHKLADLTHTQPDRLVDWFFVRLVLSAVWSIEDQGDPSVALKLALLLNE